MYFGFLMDVLVKTIYLLPFVLLIEATVLWEMKFGSPLRVGLYALVMNIVSIIARLIFIDGLLVFLLMALLHYLTTFFSISMFIRLSIMSVIVSLGGLLIAILVEQLVLKRFAPVHPKIRQAIIISNGFSHLFVFAFSITLYLNFTNYFS